MKTKIKPRSAELYFLPVETRVPFKFGHEVLTEVTCARVKMEVADADGNVSGGWGETPLNVQWAWPSQLTYRERNEAMQQFCLMLAEAWCEPMDAGHALEVGQQFLEKRLPELLTEFNASSGLDPMPRLAALVCCSAFDLALHDAFGKLLGVPTFKTFTSEYLESDLSCFVEPAAGSDVSFNGKYPSDFLVPPPDQLTACHLVGGKDLLNDSERRGDEPDDGYPVTLEEWIDRDGLTFLKIKLCGNDAEWDYDRIVRVGEIAIEKNVPWLTCDFNCTVTDPEYVNVILDRLKDEHPRFYQMILYVEQPFPYELEEHPIDVHSVSARKPLFMDESAHDWKMVRLGRELGWTGVALKTCKTLTGAILSLCWAKAHGMTLMVQDLTNPMLAQIPHCLLAAHAGTIMGVETNAMQFYPAASAQEERIHPGLYRRRNGEVDLSTLEGPGFGYRVNEMDRELPAAAGRFQTLEGELK
jgi:L-alanine-DL-glutamate epimerase-like enolase superfamily enzyme